MSELVSVIIPTFNRNDIRRALVSVLKQTYKNIEIIIIDDNNPMTTFRKSIEKAMEKYKDDPRIKYLKHERNKNGSAARNTGLKASTGQYIAFLDDDDYFLPNRIEKLVEEIKKSNDYDAAYSDTIFMRYKEVIDIGRALLTGSYEKELLLGKFQIFTGSNLFFTRRAIMDIQGFDESFSWHQDFETLIRFFQKYKILAINEPLVVKNTDDRGNIPSSEKLYEIKHSYFEKFARIINLMNDVEKKVFYKNHYINLLRNCIFNSDNAVLKKVKAEMNGVVELDYRDRILLFLERVNKHVDILKVKYAYQKFKYKKRISADDLKLIEFFENM